MKRKLFLVVFMLMISNSVIIAQHFRYTGQGVKRRTYEELSKPLMQLEATHNNVEKYLDGLVDYVIGIRTNNNIDKQLKDEMDNTYTLLKTYYDKGLALPEVQKELKDIELDIKDKILNYNKRLENEREREKQDITQINNLYNQAVDAYNQQKYGTALNYCYQITVIDKTIAEVYLISGMSKINIKDFEGAITDFESYINKGGKDMKRAYYFKGQANMMLSRYNNAIENFSSYLRYTSDFDQEILFTLARLKDDIGDTDGAISNYDEIIRNKNKTNNYYLSTSYNNKAYCLVEQGKYNEALPFVNEALKIEKNTSFIWDTRGEIYYHLKQYKKCIDDMTKSINIKIGETSHDNSYYYRGLAYIKLGKKAIGIKDIKKSAELGKKEATEWLNSHK